MVFFQASLHANISIQKPVDWRKCWKVRNEKIWQVINIRYWHTKSFLLRSKHHYIPHLCFIPLISEFILVISIFQTYLQSENSRHITLFYFHSGSFIQRPNNRRCREFLRLAFPSRLFFELQTICKRQEQQRIATRQNDTSELFIQDLICLSYFIKQSFVIWPQFVCMSQGTT